MRWCRGFAILLALGMAHPLWAGDCEPAVDLAESNDAVNRLADCDYSDTGLNGWLNNRGEAENRNEKSKPAAATSEAAVAVTPAGLSPAGVLRSIPIGSALDLVQVRFALIADGVAQCDSAFEVVAEYYEPAAKAGLFYLLLEYRCRP